MLHEMWVALKQITFTFLVALTFMMIVGALLASILTTSGGGR